MPNPLAQYHLVLLHGSVRLHGVGYGIPGYHLAVYLVGLGFLAHRLGEVAHPAGYQHLAFDTGRIQLFGKVEAHASCRLICNEGCLFSLADVADEGGHAFVGVGV